MRYTDLFESFTLYHGTPHSFQAEPDNAHGRFDDTKIGSGEDAQAYGIGLYFAENPKVALIYKNRLTKPGSYTVPMFLDDRPVTRRNWVSVEREMYEKGDRIGGMLAAVLGDANRYDLRSLRAIRDHYRPDHRGFNRHIPPVSPKLWAEALQQLGKRVRIAPSRGVLYTVSINADPETDFLNWNKSIEAQPQLAGLMDEYGVSGTYIDATTMITRHLSAPENGGDLFQAIQGQCGGKVGATKALLQAGLKGSKYLDAGSRPNGLGGYNYVIMDPKIIEIVDKKVYR